MATEQKNHGNPWTPPQVTELQNLASSNTPTPLIAHKLGRTEDSVRTKASDEGISLNPPNRSPYGTKKR